MIGNNYGCSPSRGLPEKGGRMNIVNLTPHPLNLCDEKGEVKTVIPASGRVARIEVEQRVVGYVERPEGKKWPVVTSDVGRIKGLPKPSAGSLYVVSLFVLANLPAGRSDVIAPDTGKTCVRDDAGRIVGVRQFVTQGRD